MANLSTERMNKASTERMAHGKQKHDLNDLTSRKAFVERQEEQMPASAGDDLKNDASTR